MKNKLTDLLNHQFAQLERLGDEELKGEALLQEVIRAKAVTELSQAAMGGFKLILDANKSMNGGELREVPDMFGIEKKA
ncbi:hypothetical protein CBW58_22810 [Yersinia frederiksenii]|nr:hypothetical protein CBW58_22810 [Yersinia frederiksenii]